MQGEIIKMGRIMTRIKEIKFDKKNSFDFHDKNEKMDKNMSVSFVNLKGDLIQLILNMS